jgi:hypothetical protein
MSGRLGDRGKNAVKNERYGTWISYFHTALSI